MAKIRIEVFGSGMDSECVGVFQVFQKLAHRWGYGDFLEFEYKAGQRDSPLIVATLREKELYRKEGLPTINEYRSLLKRLFPEFALI